MWIATDPPGKHLGAPDPFNLMQFFSAKLVDEEAVDEVTENANLDLLHHVQLTSGFAYMDMYVSMIQDARITEKIVHMNMPQFESLFGVFFSSMRVNDMHHIKCKRVLDYLELLHPTGSPFAKKTWATMESFLLAEKTRQREALAASLNSTLRNATQLANATGSTDKAVETDYLSKRTWWSFFTWSSLNHTEKVPPEVINTVEKLRHVQADSVVQTGSVVYTDTVTSEDTNNPTSSGGHILALDVKHTILLAMTMVLVVVL